MKDAKPNSAPVKVDLADLASGKVDSRLPTAFGKQSLGILVVEGLPSHYHELRAKVLQSAAKLAHLPESALARLEVPEAMWLVGWSRGKEKLASGMPDTLKGSFYANCDFYTGHSAASVARADAFAGYTAANVWPTELTQFESDLKQLLTLIIDVACVVAAACDRYMASLGQTGPDGETGYLERIVRTSTTTKARLLHYFAAADSAPAQQLDSWCGEHVDHSCVTALTSEYLMREAHVDGSSVELVPDAGQFADAGLFIRDADGTAVKVDIPKDALAFQTGRALELISAGVFRAIPHYVRAPGEPGINRSTLAVFCQPNLHERVGDKDFETYARAIVSGNH